MNRPKVSVFLALSLDGYIAGENDDLSWLMRYSTDPAESTGYRALMDSVDVIVMGRNTYDVVLSMSPRPYEGKKLIVLTHREIVPCHGEEAYDGALDVLLQKLWRDGLHHVYLDGGIAVRQGLELDVVDEITLSWVPIILGKGVPLFTSGLPERKWNLIKSRALPSGLLQGIYTRQKPQ